MAGLTTMMLGMALTPLAMPQERARTYQDQGADIVFDYPADWKLDRQRFANVFTFTVKNETVTVRLLKTDQRYPADHWQNSVKMVEETNGNEVLQQWEEDLLGVPLLLTRYREQRGAVRSVVLVGLLYSKTPEKLTFRVIAPEPVAADAEAAWRQVLLSTRTVSGRLPEAEDLRGTRPVDVTPPVNNDHRRTVRIGERAKEGRELYRGPARVVADEGRGLYAYLPEGWTMSGGRFSHAASGANLAASFAVGEVDAAKRDWLRQGGQMLGKLTTVGRRTEPTPFESDSGFLVFTMTRTGTVETEDVVQHVALGWMSGLSWTVSFEGSASDWKKAEGPVRDLVKRLAVASS